jgi:hypothetical protein
MPRRKTTESTETRKPNLVARVSGQSEKLTVASPARRNMRRIV